MMGSALMVGVETGAGAAGGFMGDMVVAMGSVFTLLPGEAVTNTWVLGTWEG